MKGRLTNLYDIPRHAPYLFQDPNHATKEAMSMRNKIAADVYGAHNHLPSSVSYHAVFLQNGVANIAIGVQMLWLAM